MRFHHSAGGELDRIEFGPNGNLVEMIDVQSLSEQLLFSTARLECELNDGDRSTGTAFFFQYRIDQQRTLPLLVTNKHVVRGAKVGYFHLHEAVQNGDQPSTPSLNSFQVTIQDFEKAWFMHPASDVDICVMPFEPIRQQAHSQGKAVFSRSLDDSMIPSKDVLSGLLAMEDVVMVGYPIGLWDSVNNLPILRRGITASHPVVDFQGKQRGVIDMACFPGSSGSPVLILNEGAYATRGGLVAGTRFYLLGVLFAGPVHQANGEITIVEIPTHSIAVPVTTIPIHLGYYVKACVLQDLLPVLRSAWNV